MDFNVIKTAVAAQFQHMQAYQLFRVDIDKDALWQLYLSSFPEGTNPIYRQRTEHDCSCCRHFIRTVGDVVTVIDGHLVSVWDVVVGDRAYDIVCAKLAMFVLSKPITGPFLHYEATAGTDRNFEILNVGDSLMMSEVKTWTHFFVNIDRRFIKPKVDIPALVAESHTQHDVFLRSLREITFDSIETVLDLIAQGSLYRGEEHQAMVLQFRQAKTNFTALHSWQEQELFAWTYSVSGAVSRIRNTVIGSLLADLSEGRDLEESVRSFEAKVAPTNYKRPSALITKAMIADAKTTIEFLGLTSALDRRYAKLSDITINNLMFADRSTRKALTGDVFDALEQSTSTAPKNLDKVEEVTIDRFIAEIVPRADSIEVLFENRLQGNLVSLIAPCDPTARHMFKWDNNFSWSYVGEVADAIKERVKAAGGNVTGDLCCRLAWSNYDDLDLHMVETTDNVRYEIYYGNRYQGASPNGGRLDVDMNAGVGHTRTPVENIFYADRRHMRPGTYVLFVHQYNAREKSDVGFEVEIDYLGTVQRFSYANPVRRGEKIVVAKLHYTQKDGITILESLPTTALTRTLWNLPTQTFHRVAGLMMSPNYWDGRGVGNRHYLFMLDNCRNDGTARGFFNEFLREDLNPHRKVFEVLAAKMKPEDQDDQLSGLGFSSTARNHVVCRVKGSFTRTIKVVF